MNISSAARGLAGPRDRIRWPQVDPLVLKRIEGLAAIAADLIGKFDHLVDGLLPGERLPISPISFRFQLHPNDVRALGRERPAIHLYGGIRLCIRYNRLRG